MKAKEFVLKHYPTACHFRMIDNYNRQTSSVIMKGVEYGLEIFTNHAATYEGKAWTNARKEIELQLKQTT